MSLYKHSNRLKLFFSLVNNNNKSSVCHVGNNLRRLEKPEVNTLSNKRFYSTEPTELQDASGLMEFFDDEKNWGEMEVKVGRAWKVEELRIKSNSDLHKLWYVLLKERNMLMTMEHEIERRAGMMPSPERIDKVHISMENLETVVRERNQAYYLLETGEHGERPFVEDTNCFGLKYNRGLTQHIVERRFNSSWRKNYDLYHKQTTDDFQNVKWFLSHYNEKQEAKAIAKKMSDYEKVCGLFKRFPEIDIEAVKAEYPDVDVEKARRDKRSRGHRVNNLD